MKRITYIIISTLIFLMFTLPSFAADSAKFNVRIQSQNDKQAIIAIDFEGSATFACLDMEMKVNSSSLSANKGVVGDGFKAFRDYAEDNGYVAMGSANTQVNPIKFSVVTTSSYKNVKGKDMFIITFDKKSNVAISKNDISLSITNCQTGEFKDVKTSVTYSISDGSTTLAPNNSTTSAATGVVDTTNPANPVTTVSANSSDDITVETDGETLIAQDEENSKEQTATRSIDKTKVIVIGVAVVICVLLIITAIIIYSRSRSKKKSAQIETASIENPEDDIDDTATEDTNTEENSEK